MHGVAFVVATVVALCAAVAYGDEHFDYPFRLARASSYLEGQVGLGHFRVQVQVPPEPKEQSDQTIVFFTGALGSISSVSYDFTNSGLALIWNAKHHWIASAGTVGCQPPGTSCDFVSLHGADLKVEPGDLVMLNVTDIPKKYVVGYEVSVPFKGLTTGVRTDFMLNQLYITGVFTEINTINVHAVSSSRQVRRGCSRLDTAQPSMRQRKSRSHGTFLVRRSGTRSSSSRVTGSTSTGSEKC